MSKGIIVQAEMSEGRTGECRIPMKD